MKPDCRNALQRKRHERLLARYSETFSPVRFERESCGIRGDFRQFLESYSLDSRQPRLNGGERSRALTLLRENSLLTGKNTGNFFISGPEKRHYSSYDAHAAGVIG
jgi:hypothetical protein